MKRNRIRLKRHRLLASQTETASFDTELYARLRNAYLERIAALEKEGEGDGPAFARSLEWERLGDFLRLQGSALEALQAYNEAALSCLDGTYRVYWDECYLTRMLRMRIGYLTDKCRRFCRGDARLTGLIDPAEPYGYHVSRFPR